MKIVLYQPQIPQNTGNIIRTCAATGAPLVLVKPLGFSTSNKMMRRAGLDYLQDASIEEIDNLDKILTGSFFFFSSKASKLYTDVSYTESSLLIFGNETSGLPPYLHEKYPEKFVRLPMRDGARCLNLSNSVAIALYEAIRQTDYLLDGKIKDKRIEKTSEMMAPDASGR